MIEENLSKLGFSPSEAKIYLHLLKTGGSYANRISSEIQVNRTNVYEALERLIAKGVVAFITRNKVKWYEAKPTQSLITLLEEKKEELEVTKKVLVQDMNKIIPHHQDKRPLEATIFVGKKGLRMLFEEMLEKRKSIYIIGAELQFKDFFGPYFELWHKKRIEKMIKQRSIFPEKLKNKLKERKLLEYKFVDDKFTNPTTTIIYGDTCLLIQWTKDPIAIKIQNDEMVKSHLNYFNLLWNIK